MYASKIVLWSGLSKLWFVYFVPFKCVNWWEINQLNVFPTSWCWFMCRAAEMREAPATSWYFLRCPTTETGKTCVPHLSYSQSLHMGDITFLGILSKSLCLLKRLLGRRKDHVMFHSTESFAMCPSLEGFCWPELTYPMCAVVFLLLLVCKMNCLANNVAI